MICCQQPEPDQHVQPHRHERLRASPPSAAPRPGAVLGLSAAASSVRRLQGGPAAPEHRAVDLEVVVVAAVQRVEVERALAARGTCGRPRSPPRCRRPRRHSRPQRTSMCVGMWRRWPASGTRSRSWSAAGSARSGGRHLHRVHVHVQDARDAAAVRAAHRPLQHVQRLRGVRPLGRLAGVKVPQLPRRAAISASANSAATSGRRRCAGRPRASRPRRRRSSGAQSSGGVAAG